MLSEAIGLEDSWEVEVAALLVHLGAVTLPAETAEKLYRGTTLNPGEQRMVDRVPELTRRILEHIPRLEGVVAILDSYRRDYGRTRRPGRARRSVPGCSDSPSTSMRSRRTVPIRPS